MKVESVCSRFQRIRYPRSKMELCWHVKKLVGAKLAERCWRRRALLRSRHGKRLGRPLTRKDPKSFSTMTRSS